MPDILVRDLDKKVVERLKTHARINHRSLQAEIKQILEDAAARVTAAERERMFAQLDKLLEGRTFSDSVELIREDRER